MSDRERPFNKRVLGQFTGFQLIEIQARIQKFIFEGGISDQTETTSKELAQKLEEEPERARRTQMALSVLVALKQSKDDLTKIKKVIVWSSPNERAYQLEIKPSESNKTAV